VIHNKWLYKQISVYRIHIFYFIIFLSATLRSYGTTAFGGNGLFYTQSARIIPKGYLEFFGGTRYYGKIATSGKDAYTLWNVQCFTSFNYGAGKHIELALSSIIYQDTNRGEKESVNIPDDIFLTLKVGSFNSMESPFVFGGMLGVRFPAARRHNIIYENYSAGGFEVNLSGLMSYYSNVSFPKEGWSLHTNLGYLNHNDVGKKLTDNDDDPVPKSMSSEILFNTGLFYPTGIFNFSLELCARHFLVRPPETAYSREFVSYLTLGVYYNPYRWMTFEISFDFQLFSGEDLSDYENSSLWSPPEDFPNYPTWRGMLGVKLAILPVSRYTKDSEITIDRRTILQKMMKEQQDTDNAQIELLRIRSERKRVEEELERLRKLLESEKRKSEIEDKKDQ
jgi:hypothetical protein